MVSGDDETSADAGQFGGQVQRPLGTDGFDDDRAAFACGQVADLFDDGVVVEHLNGVRGAAASGGGQGAGTARYGDDLGTGAGAQTGQERTEEADADDGDGVAFLDGRTAKDIDRTGQRLGGKGDGVEFAGQRDHLIGGGDVVWGVGVIGEQCHAIARLNAGHVGSDGVDAAPALVAGGAGVERIVEIGSALPDGEIGGANAATVQFDADFVRRRRGQGHGADVERLGRRDDGGGHGGRGDHVGRRFDRRQ